MPADPHLLPILDALGDGGNVAMAERVHRMIEDARAGAAARPAAEAFEAGKTYIIRAKDYGAADDLAPELGALHERTGADFVVFGVDLQIDAATLAAADVQALADVKSDLQKLAACLVEEFDGGEPVAEDDPHGHETVCEHAVRLLREQAAEINRLNTLLDPKRAGIRDLIEASSLGEPDAAAARATVTDEEAAAAVARAAALADKDTQDAAGDSPDDIQWDDDQQETEHQAAARAINERLQSGEITIDEADALMAEVNAAAKAAEAAANPSNAQVRDWCIANGVPVSARGRISTEARAAYDTAHQA